MSCVSLPDSKLDLQEVQSVLSRVVYLNHVHTYKPQRTPTMARDMKIITVQQMHSDVFLQRGLDSDIWS